VGVSERNVSVWQRYVIVRRCHMGVCECYVSE